MSGNPSIDRYYGQIRARTDALIRLLGDHPVTNDTVEGRVRGIAEWLDRELRQERVPIPLHRSYWGLIPMLIGSGDLDIEGSYPLLVQLKMLLDGEGLVEQPRDDLPVARRLGRFVDHYLRHGTSRNQRELSAMEEFQRIVAGLEAGEISLPLDHDDFERRFPKADWFGPLMKDDHLADLWLDLAPTLFEGRRPSGEPPIRFDAPVPGLPPKAMESRGALP